MEMCSNLMEMRSKPHRNTLWVKVGNQFLIRGMLSELEKNCSVLLKSDCSEKESLEGDSQNGLHSNIGKKCMPM